MEKYKIKIENLFLILCLLWGFLFIVINPPFQASDEDSHLYKIYGFTQGSWTFKKLSLNGIDSQNPTKKITISGQYLPAGLVKSSRLNKRIITHPEQKTSIKESFDIISTPLFKEYPVFISYSVPSYTPVAYVPAVFIIWLLSLINSPPAIMLYVGRLCCLLTYILLTFFAIKITPKGKWILFSVALLPMMIYRAGALSIDALTCGCAFLLTAYALNLIYNDDIAQISKKHNLIFMLLSTILVFCKFTYLPLILLYFLIPDKKFKNKKQKIYTSLVFLFTAFAITFLQVLITTITSAGLSANSMASGYLVLHPISFFKIILNTLYTNANEYITGFVGLFGWSDTYLPKIFVFCYIFLICMFSCIKSDNKISINKNERIFFLTICLVSFIAMYAVFSIIFQVDTKTGTLIGLQGRYLIPLAPLFFLALSNPFIEKHETLYKFTGIFLINLILVISTFTIITRFYI